MSNTVMLYLLGCEAPGIAATPYSVGGAASGSITAGTYNFCIAAFPTPDESCIDRVGWNQTEVSNDGTLNITQPHVGIAVASGNRSITFNWLAPTVPCDHFQVLYNPGILFGYWHRLKSVPGDQTSTTITTLTAITPGTGSLTLRKLDAGTKQLWFDGNLALEIVPGATLTFPGPTTYTVKSISHTDAVYFDFLPRGTQTVVTVNEAITSAVGDIGTYPTGDRLAQIVPISTAVYGSPSYNYGSIIGMGEGRQLSIVTDLNPSWRAQSFTNFAGYEAAKSWAGNCPITQLSLDVPVSQVHGWDFKRLLMWVQAKARVLVYDDCNAGFFSPFNQFRGQLGGPPTLMSKNGQHVVRIPVKVDSALGCV